MNPETDAISDAGALGDPGCMIAAAKSGNELCRLLIHRLSELEADRARVLRHLSHELKTPLAALREGVSLLRDEVVGPLTAEQREVTGILEHNTAVLQCQIEELLNYHATVLDAVVVQRRRVDLRALLEGVVASHRLQLQGQKLSVTIDCHCGQACLDPDKMRVALSNMLSNAIVYSPVGGEIRFAVAPVEGNKLFIDCIDAGPGVAPADIERIFDPFVQGGRRPAAGQHGSGVGLSIVREVAAAQGGRVYLLPTPQGAHFRMELPYEA